MNKSHYTYLIKTEDPSKELFYVGVRSCQGSPENDTKYMGSSRLVDFMRTMNISFSKVILETYETRSQAEEAEQNIFNEMKCIENPNCINLNSFQNPYQVGRATEKMLFFKRLFPQLNPGYFADKFNKIKKSELVFRVDVQDWAWFFINHPQHLKHFYFTTGTKTYWPGREDKLFSEVKGERRYYITDVEKVNGSPMEQVEQLFNEHFVKGQRAHILETACEQMLLLNDDEFLVATELMDKNIEGHNNQFFDLLSRRVRKRRRNQIWQQEQTKKYLESAAHQKYLQSDDYIKNEKMKKRLGIIT